MTDAVHIAAPIPILRIFDVAKAYEFYRDYLGFAVDWEHRFGPDFPLYAQVSRSGAKLHLSEHYGDGSPGVVLWIAVDNVTALYEEVAAKEYQFAKPGPPEPGPGGPTFGLMDPFGNKLRFAQPDPSDQPRRE